MSPQEIPSTITSREILVRVLAYKAAAFCRPMAQQHRTADGLPEWVAKTIRTIMRFYGREGNLRVRWLRTREAWVAAGMPREMPPWVVIAKRSSKEVTR